MARLVAETEAAEAAELELAAYARQDAAQAGAIMARHREHVHEAMTGVDSATWREAMQARNEALADSGYDPAATPGSAARPEVLVDGGSLPRPGAGGTARRHEPADDGLLARAAAEAEAGAQMIARHRSAARQREIARLECELAAERRVPAAPRRLVVRAEAGPPSSRTAGGPAPLAMPEAAPYLPVDW